MAPNNPLTIWGNEKTMNLNPLILTNIQSSPYFKVNLYELKTYHEVIDEIYYKVSHLEPWEKGSRKTAGQTGMCGGVRGVGAGGIVSSAYCLLYKLFTLKLTRKQVNGLLTHPDSPYIRGLGFMYIRYTQPPQDLWDWYEEYLDDDEEVDVKAGGGCMMAIGEMLRQWLAKLEWFSTLFPRIPVPVQKSIDTKLRSRPVSNPEPEPVPERIPDADLSFGEAERVASMRGGRRSPDEDSAHGGGGRRPPSGRRSPPPIRRSSPPRRSPPPARRPSPSRRSPPPQRRSSPHRRSPPPRRPSPPPRRPSPPRRGHPGARRSPPGRLLDDNDFTRELLREKERQRREKERGNKKHRSRSGSRDRERHYEKKHKRDTERHSKHRSSRSNSLSPERQRSHKDKHRSHKHSADRNGDY